MLVKAIFLLIVHEKDPSNLGHHHIYKDANFHRKRIHRAIVVRDIDETMNYILCGGLPEYPLQQCEKSWANELRVNQDYYNIRDYSSHAFS